MDDTALNKAWRKEKQTIRRELKKANISPHKMKLLETVIDNTAFMKAKLDQVKEQVSTADIVVEYDNGGGQKGIRKNPIFEGYRGLWQSYMMGMGRILDAIPEEQQKEITAKMEESKPQTVLEVIQGRRAGSA